MVLTLRPEQLADSVLRHDGRDPRGSTEQKRWLRLFLGVFARRFARHRRDRSRVHDDDRAARAVRDAVRDVVEEELRPSLHPGIPHDEDVRAGFLGGPDDDFRCVVVDEHPRLASDAGELRSDARELGCCAARARPRGGTGFRRAAGPRRKHLDDQQFGADAHRERGGPLHRSVGRLGPVGRDGHTTDVPDVGQGPSSLGDRPGRQDRHVVTTSRES